MSSTPSSVIQSLLVTASVLQTSDAATDWYCTRASMPSDPARAITIYDYAGGNPDVKWNIDRPNVQVVVRGGVNDYDTCWIKAKAIKDVLLGFESQDLDGDRWISISMTGDINFMGKDDHDRPKWSLNFNILKETALNVGAAREAL